MKRIFYLISIVSLLVLSSMGCSSKASNTQAKILFTLSDGQDAFRGLLGTAATNYAAENQINLTVVDAEGILETQLEQIKSAKENGYTAIICNLVVTETAQQMIAAADGLPIVFINSKPEDSLLKQNEYIYVGSDENYAGQLQAEYLVSYFKQKNKNSINVVLFQGHTGHPAAVGRTEEVKYQLQAAGLDVTYVFEDTANWSRQKAKDMFQIFLKTGQSYDAVICNNDEMALGVVEACKELGIDPDSIPILGVDGTSDGLQAIENGDMAFSVYQSAPGQGKAAVEAAVVLINHKSIEDIEYSSEEKLIIVPFEPISAQNVNQYK